MDQVHLRGLSLAWALCGAQAITTVIATSLIWGIWGYTSGAAAFYGGAVVIVPNAYFAFRVYSRSGGANGDQVLGAFYRAEAGKLVLTALLFIGGARVFGQHFAPLIATSIACLAMNWVLLAVARID